MVLLAATRPVIAADDEKWVRGYVKDSAGRVLIGATVTVNILDGAPSPRATLVDTTDDSGWYHVEFNPGDWDVGNTIQVISSYEGDQRTVEQSATLNIIQQIDVTYPYEISQFGSWMGFALAGALVAVVGSFFIASRKRCQS